MQPAAPLLPVSPLTWEERLPLDTKGEESNGSNTPWTHPPYVSPSMGGRGSGIPGTSEKSSNHLDLDAVLNGGSSREERGRVSLEGGGDLTEALLGDTKQSSKSGPSHIPPKSCKPSSSGMTCSSQVGKSDQINREPPDREQKPVSLPLAGQMESMTNVPLSNGRMQINHTGKVEPMSP